MLGLAWWKGPFLVFILVLMLGVLLYNWPPHFQIEDLFVREWHNEKTFVLLAIAAFVILLLPPRG